MATRFHIPPMDLGDASAYLRHHINFAGRSDQLFADDAVVRLHRPLSNGIPRALNNAAIAAVIAAASDGKQLVDDASARKAARELTPANNTRAIMPTLISSVRHVSAGCLRPASMRPATWSPSDGSAQHVAP